ncbi:hypothetical protein E2C01_085591 [Portunus trituberculatus]|uniref:Uncharacterized protein n=1 Tax=Portunus trituberculatus TaxID=210409 RepID=A0A5B7J9B0_PORTR|nr:hypothetical protein [Portunus trituberculatus]
MKKPEIASTQALSSASSPISASHKASVSHTDPGSWPFKVQVLSSSTCGVWPRRSRDGRCSGGTKATYAILT